MNIPVSAPQPDFVITNVTNGSDYLIRRDYLSKLEWPPLTHIIFPIVMPIFLILGIIGNLLTIAVIWHKDMKVSTNIIIFRVLIVTDMGVLVTWSLNGISEYYLFLIPEGSSYYLDVVYPILYIGYLYFIYLFRGINIWTTVTLCMERFVIVCVPMKAGIWCTARRAKRLLYAITVFFSIFSIQQFLEFRSISYPCFGKLCYINEFTKIGTIFYKSKVPFWLNMMLYNIIPTVALVGLSIPIVYQLCMMRRLRETMTRQSCRSLKRREANVTVVLLLVVFFSVLCNLNGPYFVAVYVYNSYESYYAYLVCIFNAIVVLNSSINFVIYGVIGERFRKILIKLFKTAYYRVLRKPLLPDIIIDRVNTMSFDTSLCERDIEQGTNHINIHIVREERKDVYI